MALDSKGWETQRERRSVRFLQVHLRQRSYVLPWSLFLFAEGADNAVRAVFHTHVVEIEGSGLSSLLSDLAEGSIQQVVEPDRTARFSSATGPQITAVSVIENK